MSANTAILWLSLLAIGVYAQEDYNDIVISTLYGKVRGYRRPVYNRAVDEYRGIRYGTPQVKEKRFKPSSAPPPWDGVYNATYWGKGCYQLPDDAFGNFSGTMMWNPNVDLSEDCLFLNVWTPHPKPENAAVMVWIYGGGFYSGVASLDVYNGATLAALEDVIVVSFNYRVASLGFFYMGHPDAPGNVGLLDQALALQWVQDNIIHFGGDPQRVTIFGESAGSVSVGLHLLSPVSRYYFTRAILQSGSPNNPWATLTTDEAKRRSIVFAEQRGCYNNTMSTEAVIKCMTKLNPVDLVVNEWIDGFHGIYSFPFIPVVDGTFLTETPLSSIERHAFKPTSIMFGSNRDEGSFFIIYYVYDYFFHNQESIINRTIFEQTIATTFPELNKIARDAISFRYIDWWNPEDGAMLRDKTDDYIADSKIHCPIHDFGYSYSSNQEDVYSYFFSQRASNNPFAEWMGVLHGDEIAFIFGQPLNSSFGFSSEDEALSRRMMRAWANFAKTGNPNKSTMDDPSPNVWPKYSTKDRLCMTLNSDALEEPQVDTEPRLDYCVFWNDYIPKLITATDDINDAERKWKEEFHKWSTKYMVDWKAEFNHYVTNKGQNCMSDNDTP
ncbi:cholinesterase-like [Glandiceps talaboti]